MHWHRASREAGRRLTSEVERARHKGLIGSGAKPRRVSAPAGTVERRRDVRLFPRRRPMAARQGGPLPVGLTEAVSTDCRSGWPKAPRLVSAAVPLILKLDVARFESGVPCGPWIPSFGPTAEAQGRRGIGRGGCDAADLATMLVIISGICEIAGGVGLLPGPLRHRSQHSDAARRSRF
jgi:hypothetical protein